MPLSARSGAAAAIVALSGLVASCGLPQAGDDRIVLTDLAGIVKQGEEHLGSTFTETEITLTVEDDAFSMLTNWKEGGGTPDECLGAFLLPLLIAVDDASRYDLTVEIGYLPAGDSGTVVVNGRVFQDDAATDAFLAAAPDVAAACPTGYRIFDYAVAVEGYRVAPLAGVPTGVDALVIDGGDEVRTALLGSRNAVIAIHADVIGGIDPAAFDAFAILIAERLAAR